MRFEIPLPPAGFQRPRPGRGTSFYSPHKPMLDNWRMLLRNQMKVNGWDLLLGPVSVGSQVGAGRTVIEVLPVIGSQPARPKGVRQDLDNLEKFIHDALEGPIYENDRQIVDQWIRFG